MRAILLSLSVVLLCLLLPVVPARGEMASARQFAIPVLTVQPDYTPNGWAVLRVSRDVMRKGDAPADARGRPVYDEGDIYAWRDDDIFVHVQELEGWVAEMKKLGKAPAGGAGVGNLVLFLNGIPLRGVRPNHYFTWKENHREDPQSATALSDREIHYLRFTISRTEESRAAWSRLLRNPSFDPLPMEVSVGFDNGEMVPTYVTASAKTRFFFRPIRLARFLTGTILILGSLLIFLMLARKTDLIRDTVMPLRPDGLRPYSLARAQMAFWFFLTVAAFFFLWVLTGAMDTLNSTVLGLIGISAATALGAAFVDAGGEPVPAEKRGRNLPAVDLSLSRRKIRLQIQENLAGAGAEQTRLEEERASIPPEDQRALDANATELQRTQERIEALQQQRGYFQWPAWRGVLNDLLTEQNSVSFHRFQILVWTLVLGVMFVANVYNELAMPEFNATLLGLLGISGGTYVGFKLPNAQRTAAA